VAQKGIFASDYDDDIGIKLFVFVVSSEEFRGSALKYVCANPLSILPSLL
jgi:hypothetical protein